MEHATPESSNAPGDPQAEAASASAAPGQEAPVIDGVARRVTETDNAGGSRRSGRWLGAAATLLALAALSQSWWLPHLVPELPAELRPPFTAALEVGGGARPAPAAGAERLLQDQINGIAARLANLEARIGAGGGAGTDPGTAAVREELVGLGQRLSALEWQLGQRPPGNGTEGEAEGLGETTAGEVQQIRERLAALEGYIADATDEVGTAVTDRLRAVLDAENARLAEAQDRLRARIDSAAQRLTLAETRLQGLIEAPAPASASQLGALQTELRALKSDLGTRVDGLEAVSRTAGQQLQQLERLAARNSGEPAALLLATGQLRQAIETGRPFSAELQALDQLLQGASLAPPPSLAALRPLADRGLQTRAELIAGFPALAAALGKTGMRIGDGSLADRMLARLGDVVTIRPTGSGAGPTEGAVAGSLAAGEPLGAAPAASGGLFAAIATAERAVAAGKLSDAATALAGLDGEAARLASPWVVTARALLAAETALDRLTALALQRLPVPAAPAGAPTR